MRALNVNKENFMTTQLHMQVQVNREGEHQRATYLMKTGYLPVGGVRFPSIGSLVASEIGPRDFDLPHFVQIGGRGLGGAINNGFLPMQFAPFGVGNPNQMPANTT